MKFISLTCTNCGATMKVDESRSSCDCEYCGNKLLVDNENININVNFEDGYNFGKEFERGRLDSQKEAYEFSKQVEADIESKLSRILPLVQSSLKVLGYFAICLFIAFILLDFIPSISFILLSGMILFIVNIIFVGLLEKNFWWLAFVVLCFIEIMF